MNIRCALGGLSVAVLAASSASAIVGNRENDTIYSQEKGYVWFSGEESAESKDSWRSNEGGKWPAVEGGMPHPNSENDYYVPYNYKRLAMRYAPNTQTEADAQPFAGRSLAVACELVTYGNYGTWSSFGDNVTMLGGSLFWWNSIGNVTGTKISLGNCNATWPVTFRYAFRRNEASPYEIKFRPVIVGDAESVLVWKHNSAPGTVGMGGKFVIASEWPDFYGTVRFQSHNNTFAPATFTTPGTVVVESNAAFLATASSGTSSLTTLKVGAGSKIGFSTVNNTQTFAISDKLELEEGAIVEGCKFKAWMSGTPKKYPVFTLSATAVAAGLPDLDGVTISRAGVSDSNVRGELPRMMFYTDELVGGGAEIGVTYREIVSITNQMSWGKTPFYPDYAETCNPVHFLSDGQSFHGGVDYSDNGHNLIMWAKAYPYVFPADATLTLWGSAFGIYGSFTCSDLTLGSNGRFRIMAGVDKRITLAGVIKTVAASNEAQVWRMNTGDRSTYEIAADVSGNGILLFGLDPETVSNATTDRRANWCGYAELKGDNSNFVGKMTVNAGAAGDFKKYFDDLGYPPYAPSAVSNVTLSVWNKSNLGGALAAFASDSLKINNECRLVLKETATFDEATRGWYFPANAYLKVEAEKAATVKQTLTFGDGAKLVKEGAGTLMLGGTPAVDEGATARPLLQVAEGGLGFASTTALAGIDAAFAAGTKLVVDVKPADADFAAKGLVPGDSTLTLPEMLPVAFAAEGLQRDESASLGVMTVATQEAADALAARIVFGRVAHHRVVKSVRANGDGTFTVAADIEPAGFALIVR